MVGSDSILGSGVVPRVAGVALTPSIWLRSLRVRMDPGLLLEGQVEALARGAY